MALLVKIKFLEKIKNIHKVYYTLYSTEHRIFTHIGPVSCIKFGLRRNLFVSFDFLVNSDNGGHLLALPGHVQSQVETLGRDDGLGVPLRLFPGLQRPAPLDLPAEEDDGGEAQEDHEELEGHDKAGDEEDLADLGQRVPLLLLVTLQVVLAAERREKASYYYISPVSPVSQRNLPRATRQVQFVSKPGQSL